MCNWVNWAESGLTALLGFFGVLVGAWLTGRYQREERRVNRVKDQLLNFYGPLVGLRDEIRVKSKLREKIHGIAQKQYLQKFIGVTDPVAKKAIEADEAPKYDKIFDYSDEQLRQELIPLYRRMLILFERKMAFAEPSTLEHLGTLIEFVEIWNRHLKEPLPKEVIDELQHSEKNLQPLYGDLDLNFKNLRKELKR